MYVYMCVNVYINTHIPITLYIYYLYMTQKKNCIYTSIYLSIFVSIFLCIRNCCYSQRGRISLLEYHDTVRMLCEVFWIHFTNGATEMKWVAQRHTPGKRRRQESDLTFWQWTQNTSHISLIVPWCSNSEILIKE